LAPRSTNSKDAIKAAHASLKMVRWAQVNVARYVGGILGSDLNAEIRAVSLDIERLWELSQISRKFDVEYLRALVEFLEQHDQKILDLILAHEDPGGEIQHP
jgi:hypothetical protein